MGLFLTLCVAVFTTFSAQAWAKSITIEADIRSEGQVRNVWSAYNVQLETNGYSKCMMKYAGYKFKCEVRAINADSFADSDSMIWMDDANFGALTFMAAANSDLPEQLRSQFYNNISSYSRNYDTLTDKPAVRFFLYDKDTQENKFLSGNASSTSIIRVRQH